MEDVPKSPPERMRPVLPAHAFVFIASFCLMVIELVAGRAMAPHLGSSLYTWTSVIGLVLTGITLGNWVGGRMADRGATWRTVGYVFGTSGFVTVMSYYSYLPLGTLTLQVGLPLPIAAFIFSLVAFFPIGFLLSLVTPIVVALSLTSLKNAGSTVGGIYAVSALGSILGTFATGFFLIAWFGVKLIVLCVGAILLVTGIVAARDRAFTASAPVILAVVLLWTGFLVPKTCDVESAYFCIRVFTHAEDGSKSLKLDHLVHSIEHADPRQLAYDYEKVYAVATEYQSVRRAGSAPLRALYVGGGAEVMPRYVGATYPGAEQVVVEIDPEVTRIVRQKFAPQHDPGIRTVNEDGRTYLMRDTATYDLVFGDAFNDFSMPYHLATEEYLGLIRARLAPGGIYALNLIDVPGRGRVLASFIKTGQVAFAHVEVAPVFTAWRDMKRNTFVLLMSDEPIDREAWSVAARTVHAERLVLKDERTVEDIAALLSRDERETFVKEKRGIALTDDYVPLDNLMAPVFVDGY